MLLGLLQAMTIVVIPTHFSVHFNILRSAIIIAIGTFARYSVNICMSLDVLTFGLNHVSAPVAVRERVSFPGDLLKPALDGLRSTFGASLREAAILSTCNRTEIYCAAEPHVSEHIPVWLADFNKLETGSLQPHLYRYQRNDAVRHAFRVASGLDSMVLGEPQILGQMKDAMRAANDAGSLGTLLHQLFQRTFSVAKEVRSQT